MVKSKTGSLSSSGSLRVSHHKIHDKLSCGVFILGFKYKILLQTKFLE